MTRNATGILLRARIGIDDCLLLLEYYALLHESSHIYDVYHHATPCANNGIRSLAF